MNKKEGKIFVFLVQKEGKSLNLSFSSLSRQIEREWWTSRMMTWTWGRDVEHSCYILWDPHVAVGELHGRWWLKSPAIERRIVSQDPHPCMPTRRPAPLIDVGDYEHQRRKWEYDWEHKCSTVLWLFIDNVYFANSSAHR